VRVIKKSSDLDNLQRGVCAAIGVFDGVHLGHQQVLAQTREDASSLGCLPVAVTFDQHPNSIVAPEHAPRLLQSLSQRLRSLEQAGMEIALVIPFNETFSRVPAEIFIRELAHDFSPLRSLCVGSDFAFGHKRGGNVDLLRKLSETYQFRVHGLSSVSLDGTPVSSTRIRKAIAEGAFDSAAEMLGRAWRMEGCVVSGDKKGRELGFPTANLNVQNRITPQPGVYAVRVFSPGSSWPGVMNIGVRPTLENSTPELRLEVHLLDFHGDLYDQNLEVTFVERLREERRFGSLVELKQQIARDIEAARRIFGSSPSADRTTG